MSQTVLCVVEFDNYPEQVVARAAWMAKAKNCDLRLLVSDPVTDFLGDAYAYLIESQLIADSIRNSQKDAMDRLAQSAEDMGLNVSVETSNERRVSRMVAEAADACKPMFVFKGTHYHSPLERATFGDVDWQLIREMQYPLWFVKPTAWHDKPLIVAAVDPVHAHDKPANLDKRIVKMAQEIAEGTGGSLQLLHTYMTLEEIGSKAMWAFKPEKIQVDEINANMREEHRRAVNILAEVCKVPADAVHVLPGRPHELLPTFVLSNKASLVVMGALQRSGIKERIIGSTAARVLDHLPCDVLIVHTA